MWFIYHLPQTALLIEMKELAHPRTHSVITYEINALS